jgi:anaerobic dimethyl sulfoxide reductase subunit B (iron-sulfur subunit)
MGKQWGFFFNQRRCIACHACSLACKAWNQEKRGDWKDNNPENIDEDPDAAGKAASMYHDQGPSSRHFSENARYAMKETWRHVTVVECGENPESLRLFNLSLSCNHCEAPSCVAACPTGHIIKETGFGLVISEPESPCISCGACRDACPWQIPQFSSPDMRYPMTKCDFCQERIAEGLKPACVAACVTRALDAAPMEELLVRYPDAQRSTPGFDPGNIGPNLLILPR